ncbi:hypothetical protein G2W53_000842 [Senna tora]|uniref:Reverse transcriptase zinc-binding domain-containing protein n=1 Tax=Senna tora TaxID=362788 RepID=A0A834XGN2_9FABA|nr:hypothetical protein G2W53_000842 [Senna tora]
MILRDFIVEEGVWNLRKLETHLLREIVDIIRNMWDPNVILGEDKVRWKYSGDGEFSVSSAYKAISKNDEESSRDDVWKRIWNWRGPQRIKTFLWLLKKGKLFTNEQRRKRKFTFGGSCPRCSFDCESNLHMIRDCKVVLHEWKKIIPAKHWVSFFNLDLEDWICFNLSNKISSVDGVAAWLLWKKRNDFVFGSQENNFGDFCTRVKILAREYGKPFVRSNRVGGSENYLDFLSDGGSQRCLWVESDSLCAINTIDKGCEVTHICSGVVNMVKDLLNRDWRVRIEKM